MKLVERANKGLHDHIEDQINDCLIGLDENILDIGCGTGAFLHRLSDKSFKNLFGLDIKAPTKINEIRFFDYDLDADVMPFENSYFKLIVCIEVLEHIENIGFLLKEISRVAADDCIILITTPNIHSIEARLRYLLLGKLKQFDEYSDPTHIHPIAILPFERLLKRYSLEIDNHWGFPINGNSPTSGSFLKVGAKLLKILGVKSNISGDHLCLKIKKIKNEKKSSSNKKEIVASHY